MLGGVTVEFRIGDRDPVTGLYDVIWPDGSFTRNGMKVFNSEHQFGDVVMGTRRSDGMMILDGLMSNHNVMVNNEVLGVQGFGDRSIGYLHGQTWNDDDEVFLPTVSIAFAPGSPTSLKRGQGSFTIRILLEPIQPRDLKFRIALSGVAEYLVHYTMSVDPTEDIIIPSGSEYREIFITPINNGLYEIISNDIIIAIQPSRLYKIGADKVVAEIIPTLFHYKIHRYIEGEGVGNPALDYISNWTVVAEGGGVISAANLAAYETAWTSLTTGFDLQGAIYLYARLPSLYGQYFYSNLAVGNNYFGVDYGSDPRLDYQFYREDNYV
jgi:hypothetical protein